MKIITKRINSIAKKFGYRFVKIEKYNLKENFAEATSFERKILNTSAKFSMTGFDRMFFLIKAIEHIKNNNVKGDFVECGVWRGGNLILFQKMMEKLKIKKKIFAYDTFEGMTEPTVHDVMLIANKANAKKIWDKNPNKIIKLAECSIDQVKENYKKNTQKNKNLICIKGPVEKTLKIIKNLPKKISILRLDTDWYESTKIELDVLFPRLEKNGILIIDDYGVWKGAKKATDKYFKNKTKTMFKIDITGRFIIKK